MQPRSALLALVALSAMAMAAPGLIGAPAAGAVPAQESMRPDMRLKFFQTPSGNIRCGVFKSGGKWSMRCDVYEHSWAAPRPDPCGGTGDYGSSVGMGRKARPTFLCVSDAVDGGRTLTYGTSIQYGPFFCRSRPKGLTCYNARAHGWFLSRQSYRFF